MGSTVFPAAGGGKTMFRTTLTSGTSYTVPAGVTYLNVTLFGGGGSAGSSGNAVDGRTGSGGGGGQVISSTLSCTPGASISYAIGAGGAAISTAGSQGDPGNAGGSTTFTGATTALGGGRGAGGGTSAPGGVNYGFYNGGLAPNGTNSSYTGAAGGAGKIDIEYWV